jgi:hypothetical protein
VKRNGLIHYTSLWTRKNRTVWFSKPDGPILPGMSIIQISDVPIFTDYFPTASWGAPSFGGCWYNQWSKLFSKHLWALPYTSLWGLCDLWEIQVRVEWDPLCEHLIFVKQSLWYLLLLEVKPLRRLGITLELSRLWWAVKKFVNVRFTFTRKEARASGVRKAIKRDSAWSWLLMGNSSFLKRDVGITWWWFRTSINKSPCSSFGLPHCVLAHRFA